MKILFIGDASNFHITLANALNEMGHKAIVVSDGSKWMNTNRDIDLSRTPGKIGSIKYLAQIIKLLPQLRGFDVVHIKNPIFFDLRPNKVRFIFDYLKRNNKKIYLSALGTDYFYVKACLDGISYKYSDFMIGNNPSPHALLSEREIKNWCDCAMVKHNQYIIDKVDGVVSCLYEYQVAYKPIIPQKLGYAGIPIDTRSITPNLIEKEPEKVRFFIGIQKDRTILKGTDLLLEAVKRINKRYPNQSEIYIAQNIPYAEYVKQLSQSHVILDQLYSYTPATNALVAMAQGLIAVSGGEDEYYDFIGEYNNRPIINVSPSENNDIENKLEWIILNKSKLQELSQKSREFVLKHNDSHVIAERHLKFWQEH